MADKNINENLPELGMQSFEMVRKDQLPDATPVEQAGTFFDAIFGFGVGIYGMALMVLGIWFALSFVMGSPSWKAGIAFGTLLVVGSFF